MRSTSFATSGDDHPRHERAHRAARSGRVHDQEARAALDAHADDDLRIPAHALAEALVHPARAAKERAAQRLISSLEIAIDLIDEATAVAAARLRAKHGPPLRMPDALVLASAEVRKARSVLTCDVRWAAWSRRVELVGT